MLIGKSNIQCPLMHFAKYYMLSVQIYKFIWSFHHADQYYIFFITDMLGDLSSGGLVKLQKKQLTDNSRRNLALIVNLLRKISKRSSPLKVLLRNVNRRGSLTKSLMMPSTTIQVPLRKETVRGQNLPRQLLRKNIAARNFQGKAPA